MAKQTRSIVFQPAAHKGLQKGINQMVKAIRPTLGPHPRHVAIGSLLDKKTPELLDNGGIIARRIIELPGRDEDVGAMLVRHLLWELHERVGDGTATAAVLFESIYNQGVTYLAAGGNAMQLRQHLEAGMALILDKLDRLTIGVKGKEELARVAESICYDPPLAKLLGEILDIVGEYGRLDVRTGRSQEMEREYIEGMYWERTVVSREMFADQVKRRTELPEAALLVSDLEIEDPRTLIPILTMTLKAKIPSLMLVVDKLSPAATALLLANQKKQKNFRVVAVYAPGSTATDKASALEDLAVLTGGRPLLRAAGDTLANIQPQELGRARRAWVNEANFGIIGGKGNPRALREHIAHLRAAFHRAEDKAGRKKLQERLGKLLGGTALLWVGGMTELQVKERKAVAERTATALRGALIDGVLPGGGMSLLACQPALQEAMAQSSSHEERAAYRILVKAVEAPLRTILENAGYDVYETMAQVKLAGPGHGFDVSAGRIVDMAEAGIFDVATAQKEAARSAITTAALALTVDVLVHRKDHQKSMKP